MALFREEVLVASRSSSITAPTFILPLSMRLISGFAIVLVLILIFCLYFVSYSKRVPVNGLLVPDRGIVRVLAPQAGVIVERKVNEGQKVVAGDVLYVLSHELSIADRGVGAKVGSEEAILATLDARRQSVNAERSAATEILTREQRQIESRITSVQAEVRELESEMAAQNERVELSKAQQGRSELIRAKGFISDAAYQQSLSDKLEQEARLSSLKRQHLSLLREINQLSADLGVQSHRAERDAAQLNRSALELEQESLAAQSRRRFYVVAPVDGLVTAILADPGQTVIGQTLLTILPANAVLEAHLYVPSAAVGFIERDQNVAVRYAAFPVAKFGQQAGKVIDVSRTVLTAQDLPPQLAGQYSGSQVALYRVRVGLSSGGMQSGGRALQLASGMQLEADVLQEKRNLWEWIFEPLRSSVKKL